MCPRVSVITATYNRSNVLRLVLESLRAQTFGDWESIVVGDHCTDDTAAVVAALDDPRIRFHNLPENFGEQSYPNNVGARMARGEVFAFLNHDDLWFPDHLEIALQALDDTGADLVFPMAAAPWPDGRLVAHEMPPGDRYRPHIRVPASLWVLRREVFDEIGPWRPAREIYNTPSQDWMMRAHVAGKHLRQVPRLTVIKFGSAAVPNLYRDRADAEQRGVFELLQDDPAGLREAILTENTAMYARLRGQPRLLPAIGHAARRVFLKRFGDKLGLPRPERPLAPLIRAIRKGADRVLGRLGRHPMEVRYARRFGKRGGVIEWLRERRGLPPLPEEEA